MMCYTDIEVYECINKVVHINIINPWQLIQFDKFGIYAKVSFTILRYESLMLIPT